LASPPSPYDLEYLARVCVSVVISIVEDILAVTEERGVDASAQIRS
jgi:hypothetical protein